MQLLNNTRETHTELTINKVSDKVSKLYAPVSTELLLQPFFDKGWEIKRKLANKTTEWYTLNHSSFLFDNGDELTLDVHNSFNGTSALKIFFGVGRIVCLNGMTVGDMDHFKYVHRGNQIYQNIENDYDKIVAKLEDVKNKVNRLNNIYLSPQEVHNTINKIASKVFESDSEKRSVEVLGVDFFTRNELLETRREADKHGDAWTQLNIVQENIVRFGKLTATIRETNKETKEIINRKITKKKSESKLSSFAINKIISDEFFKAVG